MVDRKLRQYYRNSPYCAASLIGRDNSKRRDDRFLFSALTNPDIVAPWLNVLVEHELPVGGGFSAAGSDLRHPAHPRQQVPQPAAGRRAPSRHPAHVFSATAHSA